MEPGNRTMQIEPLIRGVASGNFEEAAGAHFGSLWGWDGLMQCEASPEERAAFGATAKINLCHGNQITWLERTWSVILVYADSGKREWPVGKLYLLQQVNVHCGTNGNAFNEVHGWLENSLGKGQNLSLPQDTVQCVESRTVWQGRGGTTTLVRTPKYLQISIGSNEPPPKGSGCLGAVAFFVGIGLLFYAVC